MSNQTDVKDRLDLTTYSKSAKSKFYIYSILGILIFFVNFRIGESKQILIGHLGEFIQNLLMPIMNALIILFTLIGAIDVVRNWERYKKDTTSKIFAVIRILGFIFSIMAIFKIAPAIMLDERIFPFVLQRVAAPQVVYVPLTAAFLPFVLDSGLVEFVGMILRPIMRPIFRLPGRSTIVAITAYFSNNAVGILAVDKMYKEGKFTGKEAALLATAFCTSAISFMLIIAGILGIMPQWNLYFYGCFLILALVAIITVRIWPISRITDECYKGQKYQEEERLEGSILINAVAAGYEQAENVGFIPKRMLDAFISAVKAVSIVIPTGFVFATIGLLINYHTPIFEYIGYIFYPFAKLVGLGEHALLVAKGSVAQIVDPMTPVILGAATDSFVTKYVMAVLAIAGIIGFGQTIPVYVATDIPMKFWEILVIWIERIILIIILAALLAHGYTAIFM